MTKKAVKNISLGKYILVGKKPVKCMDVSAWGKWLETADRTVKKSAEGDVWVSTVFLGLDHSFGGKKPILFETMVFGGLYDQYQERYSTWKEAEAGHKKMCLKAFKKIII